MKKLLLTLVCLSLLVTHGRGNWFGNPTPMLLDSISYYGHALEDTTTAYEQTIQDSVSTLLDSLSAVITQLDSVMDWVYDIDKTLHDRERWFGMSGDQSGNDWADTTLTVFRAVSGNGAWGTDLNDEAKILGDDDTPVLSGNIHFDLNRFHISDVSNDNDFKLRFLWEADNTNTLNGAITAGNYTEVMFRIDSVNPQQSGNAMIRIFMPDIDSGGRVWAQCTSATDNAWVDFFVGLHEHDR